MNSGLKTILYPVKDLATAKAIFGSLLGVAPESDAPYYVGYNFSGVQIGLVPGGHDQGMNGPTPYWHVSDIKESIGGLIAAGAVAGQPPSDVGNGRLVATVKDQDGNVIGLIQDQA
jgi:predicted enzyme related to lactoylglutathione lyase